MKVALTTWGERISPVFDSARKLLIAGISNGDITDRHYETFSPEISFQLAGALKNLGIDVLICGAISQLSANIIENSGIELIPFVGGNVEEVLLSYAVGRRIVPEFSMPGCGWRHGRRKGRNGFFNQQKEVRTMPGKDRTGPQGDGAGSGRGRGGCKTGKGGGMPGQGRGRGGQGQKRGAGQGRSNIK